MARISKPETPEQKALRAERQRLRRADASYRANERAKARLAHALHPEKRREIQRRWAEKNPERMKELDRQSRQRRRDEIRAKRRALRAANIEDFRARNRDCDWAMRANLGMRDVDPSAVPPELLEAKRLQLKIRRLLKKDAK